MALLLLLITTFLIKLVWGFIQSLVGPVMEVLLAAAGAAAAPAAPARPRRVWCPLCRPRFGGVVVVFLVVSPSGVGVYFFLGNACLGAPDSVLGHVRVVRGI